ncbi:oxygen-insensitive NADPH nitroreductase [Shouchella lonarensis]|uniref:Nitroreductase n=1 Tax=Shouchella lonarensis TaxID=1464122 RepID=A0A1G6JYC4_9BACI|nr:oxygen-insensitive NADPH nitroreductase [Shouchella lonarensis]SDC23727.1 nitroreductase [Shouchella lonarensis]
MLTNDVLQTMSNHRSIRSFTDKPITDEIIDTITTAARWASTSHHVQAYSIVTIKNADTKKDFAEWTGGQPWVASCPVFFVICGDFSRHARASKQYTAPFTVGGIEQLLVATVDASLVAQNMLLAAESLGLGGVMIGGIRNEPEKVATRLQLPKYVFPVMGLALGYPTRYPAQKPRLPQNVTVHEEHYKHHRHALETYDKTISSYYEARTKGADTRNWTARMAQYTEKNKRPHLKGFLQKQGFLTE